MGHSRQAYYQGRRRQTDRLANAQAVGKRSANDTLAPSMTAC